MNPAIFHDTTISSKKTGRTASILILVINLSLIFLPGSSLHPQNDAIRIWLKIFIKRDKVQLKNGTGLYIGNDRSRTWKVLNLEKTKDRLVLNGKSFQSITIHPLGGTTIFSTMYGDKVYDGFFQISLQNGNFHIINTTRFESYLQGVISSEMGESFHLEALKAQAVLSRSYFAKMTSQFSGKEYDAVDVAGHFQAYRGLQYIGPKTRQAVIFTVNEILSADDSAFIPYFHSTCGGMLLTPEESWGGARIAAYDGMRRFDGTEEKPNCRISPYCSWKACLEDSKIYDALSYHIQSDVRNITFAFSSHGYCLSVLCDTAKGPVLIKGYTFKAYLERQGIPVIRSILFSVRKKGSTFYFRGRGFGHMVGMCQWGAEYMARKGTGYRDILRYYFPRARIMVNY